MCITELVRKAQRIVQTAVTDDAICAAARALKSLAENDLENAVESLNYASWMEA
jgi:hypothetical protein